MFVTRQFEKYFTFTVFCVFFSFFELFFYKDVLEEGAAPPKPGRNGDRERRPQTVLLFNHHFILVAVRDAPGGKPSWKIISEVMRLHDK